MLAMDTAEDPSLDVRDRVAAGSGITESRDKIWFHKLAAAVIDAGRCVRCGACVAACPSNSIAVAEDRLPTLTRMCTGCSSCWDFCPLGGLHTERLSSVWPGSNGHEPEGRPDPPSGDGPSAETGTPDVTGVGHVLAAYVARARDRLRGAQDGGVVTAMLTMLLRRGFIQGVLLTHKESPLRGRAALATTSSQVSQGAGSVYDQTHVLGALADGLPAPIEEIALVGTPCQVSGLRALQLFPWRYRRAPAANVMLTVALFCTRSFDPQRLALELVRRGVDLRRLAKVDIRDGWFRAYDADGAVVLETRVRALQCAALRGCDECADFSGELADIAVGNVGSDPGYTTVLVRTTRGAEAWAAAADALEASPLQDLSAVAALAAQNRARAARASRRKHAAGQQVWLRYSEHLAAYAGTNRAPVAPPSHRSHHYHVSC